MVPSRKSRRGSWTNWIYLAKTTFFCVGENISKHPDVFDMVLVQQEAIRWAIIPTIISPAGAQTTWIITQRNVRKCAQLVKSPLFRPPPMEDWSRIRYNFFSAIIKSLCGMYWAVILIRVPPGAMLRKRDEQSPQRIHHRFPRQHQGERKMQYTLPLVLGGIVLPGYTLWIHTSRIYLNLRMR